MSDSDHMRAEFERVAVPAFFRGRLELIEDHWQTWQEAWDAAKARYSHQKSLLRDALQEADTIMGHDDAATEWRERWAHLWAAK
jgi:hypothetical protein